MNEKKKQNWEQNVGRFILETGIIELRLLQLYWNMSLDGSYDPKIKEASFSKKITKVRSKVKSSSIGPPLKTDILNVLKECSDLVRTRNLVAHNPLSMSVFLEEEGALKYEPLIRSLRNSDKHLTEADLIKGIGATRNVIEKMSEIISDDRLWS